MKLELFYPVKPFSLNQGFGAKDSKYTALGYLGHNGLDMLALDGTIVRAAHDGEVTYAGEDGAGGLTIVIRTNDEFEYGSGQAYYKTIYCHLKKGSIVVVPHQQVKVGTLIARADNTGMSTGSHLHFGLKPIYPGEADWQWYNLEPNNGFGGAIDPTPNLNGKYAADYAPDPTKYFFNKNLKYGAIGRDVLELQKRLVAEGYGDFTPTGFFGTKTFEAVKKYQGSKGIIQTGNVYEITRAALNRDV